MRCMRMCRVTAAGMPPHQRLDIPLDFDRAQWSSQFVVNDQCYSQLIRLHWKGLQKRGLKLYVSLDTLLAGRESFPVLLDFPCMSLLHLSAHHSCNRHLATVHGQHQQPCTSASKC